MKKLILALTTALLVVVFVAPSAHADVNDFVINDFHGKYQLFKDTHGGRMEVTEILQVTFSDQNHGILRAIPTTYHKKSLRLDVTSVKRDGQQEPYTTYGQNDNEVLKIGNADKTITGPHTYEITYGMRNILGFFNDYDEWYWDINGNQWQQPFQKVSGEVIMPEGWSVEDLPTPSCYTGKQDATTSVCVMQQTPTGYAFASSIPLGPNETLTVATPFQKGLFTPRDRTDWYRDNLWQLVGLATGFFLSVLAFVQWFRWGKDHKGRGTIIPEYKPPKGLTPAEVGLLYDYSVDNRDLTATIIDLAIRGYIKVHQEEKRRLGLFKSQEFSLELTNDKTAELKPHETALLTALFSGAQAGKKISLKTVSKDKMYKAVTAIRSEIKTRLTKQYGLFEETPTKAKRMLWGIGIASVAVVFAVRPGWGWIVGLILATASAVVAGVFMQRRSHAGVKAYEEMQGLKLYMDTAEKDRLKMLESVDRQYAEPAKTVEFFEKLLPFAVALGVEQSWAKQFDNIYSQPPTWYSGNMAAFNTVYFTNSLASGIGSLNTSFSASSASSSSGSGGGGFSGGGGGGGGGGGW